MLTRVVVLCAALATLSRSCLADRSLPEIYIADGTADLALVVKITSVRTHKPVRGAVITAIRAGRGTTLLPTDPTAMPPPAKTDPRGCAILHANFRWAGFPSGSSVFVARSFLRVQAPGFHPTDARISAIGWLDFPPKTKHYQVTISIPLAHD